MVAVTHPIITRIWIICAANSLPPPPMNNPYGRPGLPGYTSFTYFSVANNAVKITPHAPQPPWSCAASSGSSNLTFSASLLHPISTSAATNPHIIAAHGWTTEHPAVMAAKPPNNPLQTSVTFQCPDRILFPKSVVNAAVQPAKVVVTAVRPMALHCP
ncbi:unnamed protein product [Fraxinus pennsylvanica]|uniref:Uncharacterized protein n=1 Tax=Fraxinus pennsylvanica TaxID=56036 RepID=A0AAD1ZKT0_9LAMI|nr:unnamed protein product [Fraxinus pennsylvanica]